MALFLCSDLHIERRLLILSQLTALLLGSVVETACGSFFSFEIACPCTFIRNKAPVGLGEVLSQKNWSLVTVVCQNCFQSRNALCNRDNCACVCLCTLKEAEFVCFSSSIRSHSTLVATREVCERIHGSTRGGNKWGSVCQCKGTPDPTL